MKTGDLIRHKRTGHMALVIEVRVSQPKPTVLAYEYIDLVWVDDPTQDTAWAGHFEVLSESR